MKKSIVVFSLLTVSVLSLWAQPTAIILKAFKKEPTIVFTAKEAVVKFDKQSFLDMYASMENGGWVERNGREHKSATTAIAWLKNQKKPVQLNENMTDQSKPETALVWLVQNLIGAPLMVKGEAEVYELKGNKKVESIYFLVEHSQLSGDGYTFLFYGQSNGFLKLWNVNEFVAFTEEVAPTVEVVFEEPVQEVVAHDPSKVYLVVEIQPEYPGGMGKWEEYIKNSLKYPKDAVNQKTEGTVYVAFVVSESGKLTDINVMKGLSISCDKEAVRLVKESIDWKPGKQAGTTVKTRMVLPIKFRLSDLEKKK
jgi:TonB family protein